MNVFTPELHSRAENVAVWHGKAYERAVKRNDLHAADHHADVIEAVVNACEHPELVAGRVARALGRKVAHKLFPRQIVETGLRGYQWISTSAY
jgi:hypothetical protein